jgi:PKD repeat protein
MKPMTNKNWTRWGLAPLIAILLVASGIPLFSSGSATVDADVCPSGCPYSSIQQAIDAKSAGETIRVGPGTYPEAIIIGESKNGLMLESISLRQATIALPSADDRVLIQASGVIVHGFEITQASQAASIQVEAPGVILRENLIQGELYVPVSLEDPRLDARFNQWGTPDWTTIPARLDAPLAGVLFTPLLLPDGTQDPPAPTVYPSGHCDAVGFTPRGIEDAIWCSHAGGIVVLHPSNEVPPIPHGVPSWDSDTPGNQIYYNRDITGLIFGSIPQWAPGWGHEKLDGLTLCSGGPKDGEFDPPSPTPGGSCVNDPDGVIVDAGVGIFRMLMDQSDNGFQRHTLDVRADDVTVSGLTIEHTTNQDDRHGLLVRGEGATITENIIQGNFRPHEHDGGSTLNQIGLELRGASNLVVDNTVQHWHNIGILVGHDSGEGNQVLDNIVQQSRWHGMLIEGPRSGSPLLEVKDNTIDRHGHSAIRFGTGDTAGYQVRGNTFGPLNVNAVTVGPWVSESNIDVRLNDWGLYHHTLLGARVSDEGTGNTVQTVPFLNAAGEAEPGLPTTTHGSHSSDPATCNAHPEADWDTAAGECVYLSIAGALAFSHAGSTVTVPGASVPGAHPYLENVVIHENSLGERLDGLTLQAGGDALSTIIDGSQASAPALTVQDAEDVLITGFTLRGADPVVRLSGADGSSVIDNLVIAQVATQARTGVQIINTQGAEIAENTITGNPHPGSLGVSFVSSDDGVARDNDILGSAGGISISLGQGAVVESNRILQTPSSATAGPTYGIIMHSGGDHTSADNIVFGSSTGLLVSGASDVSSQGDNLLAADTGVAVWPAGPQQPMGLSVTDANLRSAQTGIHLISDTSGLQVDATCNDWGAYSATGIQQKIQDDGSGNSVEFMPFRSPDASGGPFACLDLPEVTLTADPTEGSPGESVRFTVETSSDRPILQRQWFFGDGNTLSQSAPFTGDSVLHEYALPGLYYAFVVVTDSEGGQGVDVVEIDMIPQMIGPTQWLAQVGEVISLNYTAVGIVQLNAVDLPTGAQIVKDAAPDNWRLEWTPQASQVGQYTITLVGLDSLGKSVTLEVNIQVIGETPDRRVNFFKSGNQPNVVSPGDAAELNARLQNIGSDPVDIVLTSVAPNGWGVDLPGGTISISPGASLNVPINVNIGAVDGSASVRVRANVLGDPDGSMLLTWVLEAPLFVSVVMENTTVGSDITGAVVVSYANGDGVPNVFGSGSRINGPDIFGIARSTFSGHTGDDGRLEFAFPVSDAAAQVPGTHSIDTMVRGSNSNYRAHTSYQVGVI